MASHYDPRIGYNINDVKAQETRIRQHHARSVRHGAMRQFAWGLPTNPGDYDVEATLASMRKKVAKHRGETSKYAPHQGKRECARRICQGIAA